MCTSVSSQVKNFGEISRGFLHLPARVSLCFLAHTHLLPTHPLLILMLMTDQSRPSTSNVRKTDRLASTALRGYRGRAVIALSRVNYEHFTHIWLIYVGLAQARPNYVTGFTHLGILLLPPYIMQTRWLSLRQGGHTGVSSPPEERKWVKKEDDVQECC